MRDELLGELAVDDSELSLTLVTDNHPVMLTVRLEGATVAEAVETARFIAGTLKVRVSRAQEELVAALHPVVNAGYLEPGEPPVTREEFMRRAKLRGVSADADGNMSSYFDDDEMLWGHRVVFDCDRDGLCWVASAFG